MNAAVHRVFVDGGGRRKLYGSSMWLASAEGDDAANGVVRRYADGDAIAWNHLDAEAAHPAAQLCQDLVPLVALHAIQTAAVDRHDRPLHINQIVLAQMLSFLTINNCATPGRQLQGSYRVLDLFGQRTVVVTSQ